MRIFYILALIILMIVGSKTENIIQCLLAFILSEIIVIREEFHNMKKVYNGGIIGLSNNLPELLNQIKKAKI